MSQPPILSQDSFVMSDAVLYLQADASDAEPIVYTAADFRMLTDAIFANPGVVASGVGDPNHPETSMQVQVHTGGPHATLVTLKQGTIVMPKYGGGPGKYVAQLTGDLDLTIPATTATGIMSNLVVAYVLDKADAPAVEAPNAYGWAIQVLEGITPGTEPTPPVGSVVLAVVTRTSGDGSIQAPAIVDRRRVARSDLLPVAIQWQLYAGQYVDTGPRTNTWTKPFGAKSIWIRCQAGGGGGGGASGTVAMSGGGGGGGYSESWLDASVVPATVTVKTGHGGKGGTTGNGAPGGDSSFGSYVKSAGGGGGQVASGANSEGTGGAGGQYSAGIGEVRGTGSDGGRGQVLGTSVVYSSGTGGGATFGGTQLVGSFPSAGANGSAGAPFGGGGSGCYAGNATNRTGGQGAPGLVIVATFF